MSKCQPQTLPALHEIGGDRNPFKLLDKASKQRQYNDYWRPAVQRHMSSASAQFQLVRFDGDIMQPLDKNGVQATSFHEQFHISYAEAEAASHSRGSRWAFIIDPDGPEYILDETCREMKAQVEPVDIFGKFEAPTYPENVFPEVIDRFAVTQADLMGVDPGGVAMSCIAVAAAALPDTITLRAKRYENWYESARVWVALVGEPSAKKSPIMDKVARPLKQIDRRLHGQYIERKKAWDALPKDDRAGHEEPRAERTRIEDITVEAAQNVLRYSPHGALLIRDELSQWFGAMDAYNAGKGAAKDRGFWLQSFNGNEYFVDRVGRSSFAIPNLSVSALGGIQPGPIREIANGAQDDGLIQRFLPIVLDKAKEGKDVPHDDVEQPWADLINHLFALRTSLLPGMASLHFSDDAMEIRERLEKKHFDMQALESVHPKLASHIGKLDGIFVRLCVIFHAVENAGGMTLPTTVTGATAARVERLMEWLMRHALAFYAGILGNISGDEAVEKTAGYILAHKVTSFELRMFTRGDTVMKALKDRRDQERVLNRLEQFGWLTIQPGPRPSSPPRGIVNPRVHSMFDERAKSERERREAVREQMAALRAA